MKSFVIFVYCYSCILRLCTYKNSLLFTGGPIGVEHELRQVGGRLIFVISLCLALFGLVLLYQTHNPSGDVTCKYTLVSKGLIWEKEYVTFKYWHDNHSPFVFYTCSNPKYANEYLRIYYMNVIEKKNKKDLQFPFLISLLILRIIFS